MATIPKKVLDRFASALPKFKKVLKNAIKQDVNESDTVTIVVDMLSGIFGYDKYEEVTSEYAIQNTYCDLAIRINGSVHFLIEIKSVGTNLKDTHLNQAINYGAKEGIQWVILTNGHIWSVYNVKIKKKVAYTKIFDLDILETTLKSKDGIEKIFILSKEGIQKDTMKEYHERMKCVNEYVIAALILNENMLNEIRKGLRRLSTGLKVETSEIDSILRNTILRRPVLEDEGFQAAQKRIRKACKKPNKPQQ